MSQSEPGVTGNEFRSPDAFPYPTLHDVNHRCIELLVQTARGGREDTLPLIKRLREPLRQCDPQMRWRVAERNMLLVDFAFYDGPLWRHVKSEHLGRTRTPLLYAGFPRKSALSLARATLHLAWYAIQADREIAEILLGIAPEVATVIEALPLSDIDRIAERRYRHVIPRWHDQPDYWSRLLDAARTNKKTAIRTCNVRGLQMMLGAQLRVRHQ